MTAGGEADGDLQREGGAEAVLAAKSSPVLFPSAREEGSSQPGLATDTAVRSVHEG